MSNYQHQLLDLRRRQDLLGILLFSLLTICIWVAITLFTAQKKAQIAPEVQNLATPLSPNLETAVLDELETRPLYSSEELQSFTIFTLFESSQETPEILSVEEANRKAVLQNRTVVDQSLLEALVVPDEETIDSLQENQDPAVVNGGAVTPASAQPVAAGADSTPTE